MSQRLVVTMAIAMMLAIAGCATSRKLTTRDEIAEVSGNKPITVYAQGDRVYELDRYLLADSIVQGSGTLKENHETNAFNGVIPFSEIVAIKTASRSNMKGLAIAGITALFIAYAVEGTGSETGLVPNIGTHYVGPSFGGGTGTSCPYVYAWDGARYRLQAEPFGVAWGRALELTTRHLLPAARAEDGVVRLRLSNERAETHYVNSLELYRIELGTARAAVLDGEGRAWPLSHPRAPVVARDRAEHDILPLVTATDGRLWECEPSSLTAGSGYEDVIELAFARPPHGTDGSLVVTAINTELSTAVYSSMCRVVGDQVPALAHAVENDPEMIARLRDYTRDASLTVSVWSGSTWERAGALLPEASAVAFTRALRIRVPEGAGGTVRVRLRSMADVWRIDAVAADWSPARPLPMAPVPMRSAIGPSGEDLRDDLRAGDDRYAILLPPDRVELTFAAATPAAGARVAYAVAGRGYLMEWEPRLADGGITTVASLAPAEERLTLLKALMRHRELALQPVYEEWREKRERGQ